MKTNARIGIAVTTGTAVGVALWLGLYSSPDERAATRTEPELAQELVSEGGTGGLNRDAIRLLLDLGMTPETLRLARQLELASGRQIDPMALAKVMNVNSPSAIDLAREQLGAHVLGASIEAEPPTGR